MFMLDRKANQNKWGDKLIVSDRGIFSTFVYQSGILDPETEVEDIIANCETIYNSMVKNEILLPVVAINLCSVDNNYKADSDEFQRRLRKRVENKEQELDALDDVTHAMTINRIYSDITKHAQKYVAPGRLFAVDFRLPEELSLAKVTAIFDECIMGVKSTDVDESEIPNIEDGINVV